MREYPQFEDLGLWPEEDQTEDLRPGNSRTVPVEPGVTSTGEDRSDPQLTKESR